MSRIKMNVSTVDSMLNLFYGLHLHETVTDNFVVALVTQIIPITRCTASHYCSTQYMSARSVLRQLSCQKTHSFLESLKNLLLTDGWCVFTEQTQYVSVLDLLYPVTCYY